MFSKTVIVVATSKSAFYFSYICHHFFKLNQMLVLMGASEDLWVSVCVYHNSFIKLMGEMLMSLVEAADAENTTSIKYM